MPTQKATPTQKSLPGNQLTLPVIPIREGVLFPSTESVLTFGRKLSLQAIKEGEEDGKYVVLLTQKKADLENPKSDDLYQTGTLAIIEKTLVNGDSINALVRGVGRVKVQRFIQSRPFLLANVEKVYDVFTRDAELTALSNQLQKLFRQTIQMGKQIEFLNFIKLLSGVNEGEMADQVASTLAISTKEKQEILEMIEVKARIKKIIFYLSKEINVLEIEKDVSKKTQEKFDKNMRENILRERLHTIQKELGELDDDEEIINEYETKLKKAKLPKETAARVAKEIQKLEQMSPNNPESTYVRSWLDLIFELPFGKFKNKTIDTRKAAEILDRDHYGLEDVKDRVLEYMAVLQLKQMKQKQKTQNIPTILCFVGPPGVGKTSIGRSIATALGRDFTKISLGGIRDEAEIRGHRRTYVGAMPGRIIKAISNAKSMNPVFMLDEVDKLGNDFRGDPSSALLEVLDPEQNYAFEDHYLDLPFDLSNVLFIATANTLETIPDALLDRLEIIPYTGYTAAEKLEIGKRYLLPKAIKANALNKNQLQMDETILEEIIKHYVKEAGVRDLERQINKIMRKVARELLETKQKSIRIDHKKLENYLGPAIFDESLTEKESQIGLATGLAWTSVGGDVLFVEVALSPGKGQIKLTGKLGEVMKESAQAALTYVSSHHKELGISIETINKSNIHIHVPEGAVPKDGPSAGVTIVTALVSAFSKKPVRRDVAMTGEITLRGRVLRIGGLKEKAIAAYNAGSKIIIIPKENERDLVKILPLLKGQVTFKPVSDVSEVLEIALIK
ncbi:MAG TPA: endopeptidase La [Candidatus Woesebacteria bacterium]|nr:endopeptidase La [Candidatus Woesebacteria bacterium]